VTVVETHSDQAIPGENLFLDHVHPTIEGHRLLALELFTLMETLGIVKPHADWNDAAIAEVVKTIESQVDTEAHGHALSNLSQVLSWAGKQEEADKLALQAVEMIPFNAETQSLAGLVYAKRNEVEMAQEHLERALALKPTRLVALKAHTNLGVVLARQGKLDEAEAHFLQAIKADPQSAKVYNSLGMIAAQKKNLPGAGFYFDKAVHIEPEYAMAHYNLGNVLALQGQVLAAAQQFETVLQLQPNYPNARERLSSMRAMMQQRN
jgi:tetratricopeptide (TPR) repeat protein